MVYEWGKQKAPGPNTAIVKAEQVEAQEPRTFKVVTQEPEPQEPRRIVLQTQEPEPRHVVTQARPFYTIPQLAELLQVHENTIYRLVRAGKIEHYKVGAQIRISAEELERLKVERKA